MPRPVARPPRAGPAPVGRRLAPLLHAVTVVSSPASWPPPTACTAGTAGGYTVGVTPGGAPARAADGHWDFLLACLAVYILTGVGRLHQLFDFLNTLHLPLLSAGLATVAYMI